jgi:hypothetical protein
MKIGLGWTIVVETKDDDDDDDDAIDVGVWDMVVVILVHF